MVEELNQLKSYAGQAQATSQVNAKYSRIDHAIDHIRNLTAGLTLSRERLYRHAHSLGYAEPPPMPSTQATAAVPNTLTQSIGELEIEIAALNTLLDRFD